MARIWLIIGLWLSANWAGKTWRLFLGGAMFGVWFVNAYILIVVELFNYFAPEGF